MDENITISFTSSKSMEYTVLAHHSNKRVRPILRFFAIIPALLFLLMFVINIRDFHTEDSMPGILLTGLLFLYFSIGAPLVNFIRAYLIDSQNSYKITIDPISIICNKNGKKIGEYAFRDIGFTKMDNMAMIHCIPDNVFIPVPLKKSGEIRDFLNLLLENIKK